MGGNFLGDKNWLKHCRCGQFERYAEDRWQYKNVYKNYIVVQKKLADHANKIYKLSTILTLMVLLQMV